MKKLLNDRRILTAVIALAMIGVCFQANALFGVRGERRSLDRDLRNTRDSIVDLESQLEELHAQRDRGDGPQGRGPGGIETPWDDLLFDGPTAARSALQLAAGVGGTGFHRLEYASDNLNPIGAYPDDMGGGEDEMEDGEDTGPKLPVRSRYELMEWPVAIRIDADYEELVEAMYALTHSEPAFGVTEWSLEVVRDGTGRPLDRVRLEAALSTYWLVEEARS